MDKSTKPNFEKETYAGYRVILVVSELGWVDLDLRCSQGWWVAVVAT